MIRKQLIGICLMFGITASLFGQEEKTYSEEELTSYAQVMAWAEIEKESMKEVYNELIKSEELMDGGKRFLELKDANGDEAKLAEISATPEEVSAFETIQTKYDSMTGAFKEVYVSKIKEDIGAGLYNSLRKDLKADADLNARYEEIFNGLLNSDTEISEITEGESAGG